MINFIDILVCKLMKRYFKNKNINILVNDTQEVLTVDQFEKKLKENDKESEFEKYINQYW